MYSRSVLSKSRYLSQPGDPDIGQRIQRQFDGSDVEGKRELVREQYR